MCLCHLVYVCVNVCWFVCLLVRVSVTACVCVRVRVYWYLVRMCVGQCVCVGCVVPGDALTTDTWSEPWFQHVAVVNITFTGPLVWTDSLSDPKRESKKEKMSLATDCDFHINNDDVFYIT